MTEELLQAVKNGDIRKVVALTTAGVDPNSPPADPPLCAAAAAGAHLGVHVLLGAGANPNAKRADGLSAAQLAARAGSPKALLLLAAAGADLSGPPTCLELAAVGGHEGAVAALLRIGAPGVADLDVSALPACTARLISPPPPPSALVAAAAAGDTEGCIRILTSPASPSASAAVDGVTPLVAAAKAGQLSTVDLLYRFDPEGAVGARAAADAAGATNAATYLSVLMNDVIDVVHRGRADALSVLLAGGADPNTSDMVGTRLLEIAIENQDIESVKLLLDAEAPIEVPKHVSALVLSLRKGTPQITQLLLERGAKTDREDVQRQLKITTGAGIAHVHAKRGDVMKLIEMGALELLDDVSESKLAAVVDESETPALVVVAAAGNVEVVEYLLKRHVPVDICAHKGPNKGLTPLMAAVVNGFPETTAVLLSAGASLTARLGTKSVLSLAQGCGNGSVQAMIGARVKPAAYIHRCIECDLPNELALALAAAPRALETPEHGLTPLLAAALRGSFEATKILVEAGANVDAVFRSATGDRTATDLAAGAGAWATEGLLRGAGAPAPKDVQGLAAAAENGRIEDFKMLVASGVDPEAQFRGKSARDRLVAQGCNLEEYGLKNE